jgi:hypothetical protein
LVPDRAPAQILLPEWDQGLEPWEPPTEPQRDVEPSEHVRIVVMSLQEAGRTGYVPGYYICRVYPEWAWMANVAPLTRRQLEIALSAALPKAKKRTATGALLAHYLIPEPKRPAQSRKPNCPVLPDSSAAQIVAFASRRKMSQKPVHAEKLSRMAQPRQKGNHLAKAA